MDKKKINILILDLDKEMEDALKVQLQTDHIDTIFFATGRKVLLEEQVGEEKTYEMIVMPVKEKEKALAMLRRIKQHFSHKDIPIIGVFDKGCLSDLETFYEAGVTDWVEEPYTALQLAIRMKHHIAYIRLKNRSIDNEMLFQALLHNVPYMAWFKNTKSQYMKVNKELKYHCDKSFEDIQGRDDFYVWDGKIGEQCRLYDLKVMNERKSVIFNEMIPGKRGERLFEVHKAPVINAYDEVIGTVGIARDITEAVRAQQKIEQMAYMDDLTQLMNRRGMYRYFELLKEENIKEVTVFYLDLDNFKAINDSYGHYYGDQALVELANKLKSICAEGRIARLGGDEFVVVFPTKMTQEAFCEKATKLIDEGCMRFEKGETRHQVSVSIGIVQGNLSVDTMETLLIRSDLALYKAKEKGKNQYVVYTPQIEATYRKGLALEQAIYKGMQNEEFVLYYQPQYTIEHELKGFEALLRWQNEQYHQVPISEVIRTLEESRQMQKMGEWILEQAFQFSKKLNEGREKAFKISVNLSPLQLMEGNFVEKVHSLLEKTGVVPQTIVMEITENVLLEDMHTNGEKIHAIKALGIAVALDDFGTGYSSLNYLCKLPLSAIKIDKSFTKEMQDCPMYQCMIQMIVQMAKGLTLKVIAEGVETQEQLTLLKEMQVEYIQGYLWGRPMTEEKAIDLAKTSKKEISL